VSTNFIKEERSISHKKRLKKVEKALEKMLPLWSKLGLRQHQDGSLWRLQVGDFGKKPKGLYPC
jgi:hypothetical protein